MPLSLCEKLELREMRPTTIFLQLADHSIKYHVGVLEDVPIKVGDLYVPADFVILEIEEDMRTPIILGRPFLTTAGCRIDVKNGKLSFDVWDEHVEFNLFKASKFSSISDECNMIDVVDGLILETVSNVVSNDYLEHVLLNDSTTKDENLEEAMCAQFLEASQQVSPCQAKVEILKVEEELLIDEKQAPKVELKPLSSSLRYEFLGTNSTYPAIVNANLNACQVNSLLRVLREHKKAIGYTLDDLRGIHPSVCMQRILMEDDHRPTIEHQRRLNPNMQEVVKKEILKLLKAGIIYPISDNK